MLHCAASSETTGLLNAERIDLLPDGAVVVNASRGIVIDDDVLVAALKPGKLCAAGLDVFNNEPDINPEYRELPNVFLVPRNDVQPRKPATPWGFVLLTILMVFLQVVIPGTGRLETGAITFRYFR